MKRAITIIIGYLWLAHAMAMSVAFLNYGKQEEAYWRSASRAMQAAADDLGITLEISYAERKQQRMVAEAQALAARPPAKRPDYVIFSNDFALGAELLPILDGAGIKTFMAFSGRGDDVSLGLPRQRYRLWLGSLDPDAEQAGYLTTRSLIQQARARRPAAGKYELLAIGGDPVTPSSVRRSDGMRRAAREAGDVELVTEVYAAWDQARAQQQAGWLFQRHPAPDMLWAGNDLMAFGAMQAWAECCTTRGQGPLFSAINTSDQAMQALADGRLAALAGGHFMTGAIALVMLYDHWRGKDFADLGLEQTLPVFMLFDARTAKRFMQRFKGADYASIDFRRYSRVLNPARKQYSFAFGPLLR